MSGRVPFIEQFDETDCGPACLAMVGAYYGTRVSLTRLREACGTDRRGTNLAGLIEGARSLGLWARGYHGSEKDLTQQSPVPFIAHLAVGDLLHYVVVTRISGTRIRAVDPAHGRVTLRREAFVEAWSGNFIVPVPAPDFQRRDSTTNAPLFRLAAVLRPQVPALLEVFLASLLLLVCGLASFFYVRFLVDHVIPGALSRALLAASTAMVTITLLQGVLSYLRRLTLAYVGNRVDLSIVFAYLHHVLRLPMSFFDRRKVGEVMTRLHDIAEIRDVLSGVSLSVVMDSVVVVGIGLFLVLQDASLTLVALAPVPIVVSTVLLFARPFTLNQRRLMSREAATQSLVTEAITGAFTVKSCAAEDELFAEAESRMVETVKQDYRLEKLAATQAMILKIADGLGRIVFFWIGTLRVLNGSISLGELISFHALAGYFTSSLENLCTLQPELAGARVAAQRIVEILDLPAEEGNHKARRPQRFTGPVSFNAVSFRYGTRRPTLTEITMDIAAGERTALVGATGSGKSTIAKLLVKFYDPTEGSIQLDGIDLRDIDTNLLRSRIGYVAQTPLLFSGTVHYNIAIRNPAAPVEAVMEAAKLARIHDTIMTFPDRYHHLIAERGTSLSGGERQRIAIARALLGRPDLLILDEATSALDPVTEESLRAVFDDLSAIGVTIVVIAHRLTTIENCSQIHVLDRGKIVESGTHRALLDAGGTYAALWASQALVCA